jgi:hypothetical protein
MAFLVSDLLLTEEKLALLTAALANTGQVDPMGTAIAEAESTVARYTAGFDLGEDDRKALVRRVALFNAYALAGPVPDEIGKAYDKAMDELRDIRDGKFVQSAQDKTGSSQGKSGSSPKINPR